MTEIQPETSEIQLRRAKVQKYVDEVLPTEYPSGRAVLLWQNWWEVVGKIIDFYDDEPKGLVGKSFERTAEESDKVWKEMKNLTGEIQSKLKVSDKLSDDQLNVWLGRVTPVQLQAIIDGVTESSLPVYSKSPRERFNDSVKDVASQ